MELLFRLSTAGKLLVIKPNLLGQDHPASIDEQRYLALPIKEGGSPSRYWERSLSMFIAVVDSLLNLFRVDFIYSLKTRHGISPEERRTDKLKIFRVKGNQMRSSSRKDRFVGLSEPAGVSLLYSPERYVIHFNQDKWIETRSWILSGGNSHNHLFPLMLWNRQDKDATIPDKRRKLTLRDGFAFRRSQASNSFSPGCAAGINSIFTQKLLGEQLKLPTPTSKHWIRHTRMVPGTVLP